MSLNGEFKMKIINKLILLLAISLCPYMIKSAGVSDTQRTVIQYKKQYTGFEEFLKENAINESNIESIHLLEVFPEPIIKVTMKDATVYNFRTKGEKTDFVYTPSEQKQQPDIQTIVNKYIKEYPAFEEFLTKNNISISNIESIRELEIFPPIIEVITKDKQIYKFKTSHRE